jgi:hypothetical protein
MREPAPLLVFSDDWGRHPSSCQYIIRHLLPHRRVTWVNTIGLRRPRFDWATASRGLEKLRSWVQLPLPLTSSPRGSGGTDPRPSPLGGGAGEATPLVLNPRMWPSFRSRFGRGLNRRLLTRAVRSITEDGPAPIVITTLPLVADLVGRIRAARWVYYCVDDYSVWPGLDGRTLRDMEAELVAKVDVALAVSEPLQAHLARLGRSAHLLTHGVEPHAWCKPDRHGLPMTLASLDGIDGPLVVFWGMIDRRMDLQFLRKLSESMKVGRIALVGPRDNPDPRLARLPRVGLFPAVPPSALPALADRAAVLIAPYADLPVTRAMQPLKLKEYLATGKPVVVRKLPATAEWADCCDVVETPEEFARVVLKRLPDGISPNQVVARQRLEAESWAAKAALFERWVDGK